MKSKRKGVITIQVNPEKYEKYLSIVGRHKLMKGDVNNTLFDKDMDRIISEDKLDEELIEKITKG